MAVVKATGALFSSEASSACIHQHFLSIRNIGKCVPNHSQELQNQKQDHKTSHSQSKGRPEGETHEEKVQDRSWSSLPLTHRLDLLQGPKQKSSGEDRKNRSQRVCRCKALGTSDDLEDKEGS